MTVLLITAIIAYLSVFTIVGWRNRYCGLLWIAFALPTYGVRFSLGPIPTTLLETTIAILTLITLIQERESIFKKIKSLARSTVLQKTLLATLGLFLISATISIFTSPSIIRSLGIWRAYFIEPALLFIIILLTIKTAKKVRGIVWAMAGTMALISLVAIYQKFTGWNIPITWLAERRVTGIFSYPNAVGLYLAPLIPITTALIAYYTRQKKKILASILILVVLLSFTAIVFAKTEAAIVALAGSLGLFGLLWSSRTRYSALLITALTATLIIVSPPVHDLVQEKLLLRDWSGHVRMTIWKETGAMLHDHWLTGAGLAGYQEVFKPYHKTTYVEIFLYPHNIVMNFWSELGLYGVISFFAMVFAWMLVLLSSLRSSWKVKNTQLDTISVRALSLGLLCSVVTLLIHGLVDVPFFKNDLAAQFFFLIALSLVVYNNSRLITSESTQ